MMLVFSSNGYHFHRCSRPFGYSTVSQGMRVCPRIPQLAKPSRPYPIWISRRASTSTSTSSCIHYTTINYIPSFTSTAWNESGSFYIPLHSLIHIYPRGSYWFTVAGRHHHLPRSLRRRTPPSIPQNNSQNFRNIHHQPQPTRISEYLSSYCLFYLILLFFFLSYLSIKQPENHRQLLVS